MEFNKPKPFTFTISNVRKDWQTWKKEFLVYLKISGGYTKFTEEDRALLLINLMGTEAIKAMNDMTFDHPNERNDMDILLMKFDNVFDPPLNEREERYKFFLKRKTKNESIQNYVIYLKEKAAMCNFGDQSDKMILDMLILSMDSDLRKIIFALEDVTLESVIFQYDMYNKQNEKIKEITKDMTKNFKSESSKNISKQNSASPNQVQSKPTTSANIEKIQSHRICSKCGQHHEFRNCPAFNFICHKCFTKGHYTNKCKASESTGNVNTNISKITHSSKDDRNKQSQNPFNSQDSSIKPSAVNTLKNCCWCETKHLKGQCPHDQNCTRCSLYPHNVCFQCKKNPHDNNCNSKKSNQKSDQCTIS